MILTTLQQAEFSYGFIRAVAATAGCAIADPRPDRKSVDFTISSDEHRCPKIDVQVKSTKNFKLEEEKISYPLKVKNYNDLIADVSTPRILVLVTIPSLWEEWITVSEQSLSLQHCAYWVSLKGLPVTEAEETVTVYLRRSDIFNVKILQEMMKKAADGVEL